MGWGKLKINTAEVKSEYYILYPDLRYVLKSFPFQEHLYDMFPLSFYAKNIPVRLPLIKAAGVSVWTGLQAAARTSCHAPAQTCGQTPWARDGEPTRARWLCSPLQTQGTSPPRHPAAPQAQMVWVAVAELMGSITCRDTESRPQWVGGENHKRDKR